MDADAVSWDDAQSILDAITAPPVMLPAQLPARAESDELRDAKRLALEVLLFAFEDVAGRGKSPPCGHWKSGARELAKRRVQWSARLWFRDTASDGPMSLVGVCELLGLDVGRVQAVSITRLG